MSSVELPGMWEHADLEGGETDDRPVVICAWFLRCDHPSAGVVEHPHLGEVPTCERCAEKLELTFVRCDMCGERKRPDPFEEWGEFVDPCTNDSSSATDYVNDHVQGHAQCGIDAGYELA